jgi:branched-chain amino acid aminotransferase
MEHIKYVILNGEALKISDPVFYNYNRGFRFGDAVFETMHANGTETQFFEDHYIRIKDAMKLFRMKVPVNFKPSLIYSEIKSLLVRNKLFQGAKVRLSIFRNGAGAYTPETDDVSYFIETEKIPSDKYELNQKGIIIDIYNDLKKPINSFANFKISSAYIYVMASICKRDNNLGDVLLINENGNIIEATSSNLFIVKNDQIYTPSLEEGCVRGIMRNKIIDYCLDLNYTVFDDCTFSSDDLLNADEVFLTNAIVGIKWVLAFKERRFFNKTSKILMRKLNEVAFN